MDKKAGGILDLENKPEEDTEVEGSKFSKLLRDCSEASVAWKKFSFWVMTQNEVTIRLMVSQFMIQHILEL